MAVHGRAIGLISLLLITSAACADKAPPALFPHPQPPELAQPIGPSACPDQPRPEGGSDPTNPPDPSRSCEDDGAAPAARP